MKIITKCDKKISPPKYSEVITKYVRYYKVWKNLLHSAPGITKCDNYYKLRQYNTLLNRYKGTELFRNDWSLIIRRLSLISNKTFCSHEPKY